MSTSDFPERYQAAIGAFNGRDLDAAAVEVTPDFEMHLLPEAPEDVVRGADGLRRYWDELLDVFPDWHSELRECTEIGDGLYLAWIRVGGVGPSSGIDAKFDIYEIWELDADGVPLRVRQFRERAEAMSAAA